MARTKSKKKSEQDRFSWGPEEDPNLARQPIQREPERYWTEPAAGEPRRRIRFGSCNRRLTVVSRWPADAERPKSYVDISPAFQQVRDEYEFHWLDLDHRIFTDAEFYWLAHDNADNLRLATPGEDMPWAHLVEFDRDDWNPSVTITINPDGSGFLRQVAGITPMRICIPEKEALEKYAIAESEGSA